MHGRAALATAWQRRTAAPLLQVKTRRHITDTKMSGNCWHLLKTYWKRCSDKIYAPFFVLGIVLAAKYC